MRSTTALVLLGVALTGGIAHAETVVLIPDRDNTIFESNAGNSNALGNLIFGTTNSAGRRRALLRFDVAGSLPAGATVTAARLELEIVQASGGALATDVAALHRSDADWGEGTSLSAGGQGAAATTGDATWTERFFDQTQSWTTVGGDFQATASGSATTPTLGPFTIPSQPGMVADVQSWLDAPANNHGWFVLGTEQRNMTTRVTPSREDAGMEPRLVVDFTPAAPIPAASRLVLAALSLLLAGTALLLLRRAI